MLATSPQALRLKSHLCQLLILLAFPLLATAHSLSKEECGEGADYIRHAALSRDAGMTEAQFLEVFDNDLVLLMAIPPSLRWFVQDDDDTEFLRAALLDVYRNPKTPDQHAINFANACLVRAGEPELNGTVRI
jgi:hypothetical protein